MKITFAISLFISFAFSCCANEEKPKAENLVKVLYVTHEPGQYHDYTGQRKVFEAIAKDQPWETTILSESYEGLVQRFAEDGDFAKDYEVVVYNICLAEAKSPDAVYNVMKQTREHGVNALLVHGALHSFWPTFSPKGAKGVKPNDLVQQGLGKGVVDPKLLSEWNEQNPGKDFPVWGDFCGCASMRHEKKAPISVKKLIKHDAVKGVEESYKTGLSELYIAAYKMEHVSEILEGSIELKSKKSKSKKTKPTNTTSTAPILWEMPYHESKVMAFTLGHFTDEWETPEFQSVLVNSINYLAKKQ